MKKCVVGISIKQTEMASITFEFKTYGKYQTLNHYIVTKDKFDKDEKINEFEYLTISNNYVVSYEEIFECVKKAEKDLGLEIVAICYDPFYESCTELFKVQGYNLIRVRQGAFTLNETIRELHEIDISNDNVIDYTIETAKFIMKQLKFMFLDCKETYNSLALESIINAHYKARELL